MVNTHSDPEKQSDLGDTFSGSVADLPFPFSPNVSKT